MFDAYACPDDLSGNRTSFESLEQDIEACSGAQEISGEIMSHCETCAHYVERAQERDIQAQGIKTSVVRNPTS